MTLKKCHSELFCRVTYFNSCHVHASTNLQNVSVVALIKSFILGSSLSVQSLVDIASGFSVEVIYVAQSPGK